MYFSETQKIREKVIEYVEKPCIDYGCGHDKIIKEAIGVDCRPILGVNIVCDLDSKEAKAKLTSFKGTVKTIYSSHFLEHCKDDRAMLAWWIDLLAPGGHLILYLPDDEHYNNDANPEHLHRYTWDSFSEMIIGDFRTVELIEGGPDVGEDRYSFYVVLRKLS